MSGIELITKERVEAYLRGAPAESQQFAFLQGGWKTKLQRLDSSGEITFETNGEWHGRWLHENRIFFDEFHSFAPGGDPQISYMSTLRTFDPKTNQWEMTFLVAHQPPVLSRFYGNSVDGEMHLMGQGETPDGRMFHSKVRFHSISADGFVWDNHLSLDDGATWQAQSRIVATRKDAAA